MVSNEALSKAVEMTPMQAVDFLKSRCDPRYIRPTSDAVADIIEQALRGQEAEIAGYRLDERKRIAEAVELSAWAEQAESALATHRANYDALVILLGDVTARLEAADGLLRDALRYLDPRQYSEVIARITTHLKAADHA